MGDADYDHGAAESVAEVDAFGEGAIGYSKEGGTAFGRREDGGGIGLERCGLGYGGVCASTGR